MWRAEAHLGMKAVSVWEGEGHDTCDSEAAHNPFKIFALIGVTFFHRGSTSTSSAPTSFASLPVLPYTFFPPPSRGPWAEQKSVTTAAVAPGRWCHAGAGPSSGRDRTRSRQKTGPHTHLASRCARGRHFCPPPFRFIFTFQTLRSNVCLMFVAAFHLGYRCRHLPVAGKGADNIGVKAGKKSNPQEGERVASLRASLKLRGEIVYREANNGLHVVA